MAKQFWSCGWEDTVKDMDCSQKYVYTATHAEQNIIFLQKV